MSARLEDRNPGDTGLYQSIFYRIQLGRLNNCLNLLHFYLSFLPASTACLSAFPVIAFFAMLRQVESRAFVIFTDPQANQLINYK